jgi:hypothetical protein
MDRQNKISSEVVEKRKQHARNEKYSKDLESVGQLIGEVI